MIAFFLQTSPTQDNTLVILDPVVVEGAGQPLDVATVAEVGLGVEGNPPAKIDPLLPGVPHPAQRGTPGLDTIDESWVNQCAHGGAPQVPVLTIVGSQGHAAPTAVQSDAGKGVVSEADRPGDPLVRVSQGNSAFVSGPVSSETGDIGNGACFFEETGSAEQFRDPKSAEHPPAQPGVGARGDNGDASLVEAEEAQYGGHKIPGNPPFESDDDEDEQDNDMSHPEGFLRAMPEDESAMRVLKLPDGRIRRVEDDEEDEASSDEDSPADDFETAPQTLTAPSSDQAPPLSSVPTALASPEIVAPPTIERPVVAVAPPVLQAPRPPRVGMDPFLSAGYRSMVSAGAEGGLLTKGVSSSGTNTLPPRVVAPTMGVHGTAFSSVRGARDQQASAALRAALASDPGLASQPVGPPVPLQRARSFSPSEVILPEELSAADLPPMQLAPTGPAPSFPAPRPPGVQPADVLGTGNGPGTSLPIGYPGDKPPLTVQTDQELQELLSGRALGPGQRQAEIKIANLQGPDQEIMRLVMHTQIEGRLQEVEFGFNLDHDHPEQVCWVWEEGCFCYRDYTPTAVR